MKCTCLVLASMAACNGNVVEPKSTDLKHLEAGSLLQSRSHMMSDQQIGAGAEEGVVGDFEGGINGHSAGGAVVNSSGHEMSVGGKGPRRSKFTLAEDCKATLGAADGEQQKESCCKMVTADEAGGCIYFQPLGFAAPAGSIFDCTIIPIALVQNQFLLSDCREEGSKEGSSLVQRDYSWIGGYGCQWCRGSYG